MKGPITRMVTRMTTREMTRVMTAPKTVLTRQWQTPRALLRALTLVTTLGATVACRETKSETAIAVGAEPAGGAVTLWTDSTELFMEHPALIVGAPDKFAVHLTDLTDFAPLRSGRVTLRFVPRAGGAPVVVTQETPRAPGIYGPSPEFTVPGVYDLSILVESPQAMDSLYVPGLRVYASTAEAPKDDGAEGSGISFLKEQQWKTPGFASAFADSGTLSGTFDVTGSIEPSAGRQAEVSAPISGVIDVGSMANTPAPGQRVSRGHVLLTLTPALGEAGSAIAEARARLAEAEDELQRAKRLVDAEAAPARRLREAEIRLRATQEALASFGGALEGGKVLVRAPIGGVVSRRVAMPGSRVDAGASLFSIVDPSVVWLTVNVPAAQASLLGRGAGAGADFRLEGSTQRFATRRTVSVGAVLDPMSRTLPVIFEVDNARGDIRVGSVATASVRTGVPVAGLLLPASAILEEDGRPFVFVQLDGETFERRDVRIGARRANRVLVVDGLSARERVVTGAAYQVRLASLSTAVPAQGHEH